MARQFDIIISGGGLVGCAAACLLAREGFTVAVVERGDGDGDLDRDRAGDGRVSAINLAGAALFEKLGVWRSIAGDACAYRAMKVWDRHSAAKIAFTAADVGQASLGSIVANRAMVAALRAKLRAADRVEFIPGAEIAGIAAADAGVRVELAGETLAAQLLVAADGAESRVRELAGISAARRDFQQDAITATVAVADHRHTAWQVFLATGPAALLPLAGGRCALVWSCRRALADALMQLPAAEFCARLQAVFDGDDGDGDGDIHPRHPRSPLSGGGFDGEIGEITDPGPRRRFQLIQHHADAYHAPTMPVALIGDAAHAIHPLAGLGANLGLVDAAALAEVAAGARAAGRGLGQYGTLRRYARWRRGDNAAAVALMAGFHDLFGSPAPAAKLARAAGFTVADNLPPLKAALAGIATGLCGDLPKVCRV